MREPDFEWDESKNSENLKKHEVSFHDAQFAFLDRRRVIAKDHTHSKKEQKFYCFESVRDGFEDMKYLFVLADLNPDCELLSVRTFFGLTEFEYDPEK